MSQVQDLPDVIKEVGFDFSWDVRKVWALDVSIEEMLLQDLAWHFDVPFWSTPGKQYSLRPRAVIDCPDDFVLEYERIMSADTSYPIDIMFWRGRWLILDGLHRLTKMRIQGFNAVNVRKISRSAIPKISK